MKGDTELFVGAVGSQSDLEAWKKVFTEAFSKEPAEPLAQGGDGKKKKQTVGMKIKKGAASKTANSAVGKKVRFVILTLV